jgi:chemotaxis protein MotA
MDLASVLGTILAFVAIVGGHLFEGGHIGDITQSTAFLIVFGGTFACVFTQFSPEVIIRSMKDLKKVYKNKPPDYRAMIRQIVDMSSKARREGVLAIERELANVSDPFLNKALGMVADGMKVNDIKPTLELEIDTYTEHVSQSAKFWEAAGGYSPTIGIVGAVMGLIHVMGNLSDPSALGAGIAVAFVATLYGVGAANLFFLPWGGKLMQRVRDEEIAMELIIEGACAISTGESPLITERKLAIYAQHRKGGADPEDAGAAVGAEAGAAA